MNFPHLLDPSNSFQPLETKPEEWNEYMDRSFGSRSGSRDCGFVPQCKAEKAIGLPRPSNLVFDP